jgi:cystathionine gamma-synthase
MRLETRFVQAGNRRDATGALSFPVHRASTYAHPALGQSTGFDYTRTQNPTRKVLEDEFATFESGVRAFAFSSGMAAVHAVSGLFRPGDRIVASDDLYGGTYRLFEQILRPLGVECTYVDTSNLDAVAAVLPGSRALFVETPTNPTMKITDIAGCAELARRHGVLLVVDNTFMTPYFQRPLELGADIVLHSATKYLGGHNDVLAGLVVVRTEELAERIAFYQNSIGAVLSPDDCWLLLRGMKTLALRMERHEQNARRIAAWLAEHPSVNRIYYPGLPDHPGRPVHERQASGYGGMISFEVRDEAMIEPILANVRVITFAESLGGVESLITYPARQTHFDIPKEVREAAGVTDRLLRLSVGVEHVDDLIEDLAQAFEIAEREAARQSTRIPNSSR